MKKLRHAKRVTLQQVARHTKIQQCYLEDLERGTYNDLPADVYVRGFLRSYADYFGVNDVTLIRLYNRERGIYDSMSEEGDVEATQKPLKVKRFIVTPRMMIIIAGLIIFSGVFIYLYSELRHFVSAPWLVVESPTEGSTINERTVTVNGRTDQEARVSVNAQGIIVNQDGSFEETISLQNGINTITVKSINSFDKESENIITIYGQYEDIEEEEEEKKVFLEITADKADIAVIVKADEEVIFDGEILSQESQSFQAIEEISITSDRGNATLVIVNDREYGPLGETRESVEDVIFTENSALEDEDADEDEENVEDIGIVEKDPLLEEESAQ